MAEETTTTPPETPATTPVVTPQMVQSTYTLAMVFAIISLVSFLWLAPVAVGFGIAAVVLVSKGRKQTIAAGEQPPRSFTPQFVMGLIGLIGGAIVTVFVVILPLLGLFIFSGGIINSELERRNNGSSGSYEQSIATLRSAKKSFTSTETIAYGPYDLKISDVQKNYTPTASEKADMKRATGTATEYMKFAVAISLNESRESTYSKIKMDLYSWGYGLANADMAGSKCVWHSISDSELRSYNYFMNETRAPEEVSFICRSTGAEDVLDIDITVFTKLLPIVGTEGAPREDFEYKVAF